MGKSKEPPHGILRSIYASPSIATIAINAAGYYAVGCIQGKV